MLSFQMLALSVLDIILSMDKFQQWLTFMTSKGYLQHLVDSLVHDDNQLQSLLGPNPQLRILYIYESKMVIKYYNILWIAINYVLFILSVKAYSVLFKHI